MVLYLFFSFLRIFAIQFIQTVHHFKIVIDLSYPDKRGVRVCEAGSGYRMCLDQTEIILSYTDDSDSTYHTRR